MKWASCWQLAHFLYRNISGEYSGLFMSNERKPLLILF